MDEKDLLFNFMDNLQNWAEQELRRRGVQDLSTAMVVVESLMDFRRGDSSQEKPPSKGGNAKGGGDRWNKNDTKEGSIQTLRASKHCRELFFNREFFFLSSVLSISLRFQVEGRSRA